MSKLQSVRKTAFAGAAGNVMEWYDFATYAYMAPIIATLFFPSDDHFASIMTTYGVFAAGYLSRPLGGMIFGHIGDKLGRKKVLILSVSLMGFSTVSIGLLPTEAVIGPLAAVLLVVLRIAQGLSVGGEYTGSATFVVENAPRDKRAFYSSWIVSGAAGGFLLGSGVATLLTNFMDADALHSWGWRLPFLSGALIAIVAYILRRHIEEPVKPKDFKKPEKSPVISAFRDHWRDMLRVMGLALSVNVGFYLMFVYAISFLTDRMHVSTANAMDINTFCLVLMTILPIPFAMASDKIGRKPVLLSGALGIIVLSWPLFWFMHHTDLTMIILGQVGFAVLFSWVFAANPVTMVEILPRNVRVSVLSIGYNICLSIFGGTTPLVATYLVNRTSDDFAPVYYLMGLAVISLIAVLSIKETGGKPLRE
ncbi:MAG: MFS transporter [Sphingomonadales bacterium]